MDKVAFWNSLPLPDICNTKATEKDYIFLFFGYAFLIETKNGCNNVIVYRFQKTKVTFLKAMIFFLKYCRSNRIQYIRVKGKKYSFLLNEKFLAEYRKRGADAVKDEEQSKKLGTGVYYIKTY